MATTVIKVYHNRYKCWAERIKVCLSFDNSLGGFSDEVYTDKNGTAIIDHKSTGMAMVYLNGMKTKKIYTPSSEIFYID